MVTFETKVWERDWRFILKGNYLNKMIERCNHMFDKKHIIINNVHNRRKVEAYCEQKIKDNTIDAYYFAEDYAEEVLQHFKIDMASFQGGYYYSIAELVGIFLCQTPFLLHFSSDACMMEHRSNWIAEAVSIMTQQNNILVANPTWNYKFHEAKAESFDEIENFFLGYGFSDQCYLIKAENFRRDIYQEQHDLSARYPKYGGELFEKRVDAYMRNHQRYRITSKEATYFHKNFPKNSIIRKIGPLRDYFAQRRISKMKPK